MSGAVLVAGLFFISTGALPAQAAELTAAQINSIVSLLQVFGADQSVVANVRSSLTGTPASVTSNTTTGSTSGGSTGAPMPTAATPPYPPTETTYEAIPHFDRDLYLGVKRSSDVSDLQEFLTDQGYYAGPISGNYGLLTVQAVKKFQAANGITASGYFGARSRALANQIIQKLVGQICGEEGCDNNVVPIEKISIAAVTELTGTASEYMKIAFQVSGGSGNYSIHVMDGNIPGVERSDGNYPSDTFVLTGTPKKSGVYHVVLFAQDTGSKTAYGKERFTIVIKDKTSVRQQPVISGVSGPSTLKVGEEGTWTINASDPQNGVLNYKVVWGDEVTGAETMGVGRSVPSDRPYVQATTFSHTYRTAGVYTPLFYVVNDSGLVAKTSISVKVGETNPPVPTTPSLSYLQSKAEDQNVLHPGESHVLYGSNLTSSLKLWINGQGVSVYKVYPDGNGLEFIAPTDLASGTAYVNVTDASGRYSNKIAVRVAASTITPSISYAEIPVPTHTLTNGDLVLYRLSAKAGNRDAIITSPIQFYFSGLRTSLAVVQVNAYNDSSFRIQNGRGSIVAGTGVAVTPEPTMINFRSDGPDAYTIPANSTIYLEVVGRVAVQENGSLSVGFKGLSNTAFTVVDQPTTTASTSQTTNTSVPSTSGGTTSTAASQ